MADMHHFECCFDKAPFHFLALNQVAASPAHTGTPARPQYVELGTKRAAVTRPIRRSRRDRRPWLARAAGQGASRPHSASEKAEAKRDAATAGILQAETRCATAVWPTWEFTEKRCADNHTAWLAKTAAPRAILEEFAIQLEDGKGGFCTSVAKQLIKGDLPSPRALNIAKEIVAKQSGRKNSKAFVAALAQIEATIDPAIAALEGVA
jgi:hypothetical protein